MASTTLAETYVLAQNKQPVLSTLVSGTKDYYFYNILHLLASDGKSGEIKKLLDEFYSHFSYDKDYQELKQRFELAGKDLTKYCEWAVDNLQVSYNHYRQPVDESPDAATSYSTEATQNDLLWPTLFKKAYYSSEFALNKWVAAERVFTDGKKDWKKESVDSLVAPDAEKLVDNLVSWMKEEYGDGWGSRDIHSRLTLKQLDQLRSEKSSLINDSGFIGAYVARLAPSDDVDIETDQAERLAYFDRLKKFIWKLGPGWNNYRLLLLFQILKDNVQQGKYDQETLLEYIKIGKSSSYIASKFYEKATKEDGYVQIHNVPSAYGIPAFNQTQDETLVRQHFHQFLRGKDSSYSQFTQWVSDTWLQTVDAEAKLLYGEGDPEKYVGVLGSSTVQKLKADIEITLLPSNPKYFHPKDSVSIDVQLKNVPVLIVKVFEINTSRYYKDNHREVPTDIQLDGLVANEEKTYKFDHPPVRRFTQKFDFPSMKRRGLFVVEFIGNGMSSRCVVRKGKLSFVDRISSAGHIFTLVDEDYQPLKKATLWLSGHQFTPDKDGVITVPFTNSATTQSIMLVNEEDNFCSLEKFDHREEDYEFSAKFFVDRETLLTRNKTSVVIRSLLKVHNVPITLSLLEELSLNITTNDIDDVAASKDVRNLKFDDSKELTVDFSVPDKLASISFTLSGKVKKISTGDYENFSKNYVVTVNGIEKQQAFSSWHLRRTPKGYEALLLGKTGEPLKNRSVSIYFKHRYMAHNESSQTLQSNAAGVIFLGPLPEIEYLYCSDSQNRKWYLARDLHNYPTVINAKEGDTIQVAFMSTEDGKLRTRDVALMEFRQETLVADHFDKVSLEDGLLTLKGLQASNYELYLKEAQHKVTIHVTKGTAHSDWIFGRRRLLDEQDLLPLQISTITQTKDKINIQLVNSNSHARVHVFATEFFPDFDAQAFVRPDARSGTEVTFNRIPSDYLNGRTLGEEYRYILERKFHEVYPGNTLTRPSLLLQPWAVQSTSTTTKTAASGSSYGSVGAAYGRSADKGDGYYGGQVHDNKSSYHNLDFKKQGAVQLFNLVPNKDGLVSLDLAKVLPNGLLRVVAIDDESEIFREFVVNGAQLQFKDLRLRVDKGLDPDGHFTEQKHISEIQSGETFTVGDISTSKVEIFDTVTKVAGLLSTLSGGNATFQEFNFVLTWDKLSENDKREKFSKYSCHELNFFIYKKDQSFFTRVVKPYLINKKEKTYIDYWLIDSGMADYLEPQEYSKLNVFEKIILAERLPSAAASIAHHFTDLSETQAFNAPLFNSLFAAAIKGSSLDTDDAFDLQKAQDEEEKRKDDEYVAAGLSYGENEDDEAPGGGAPMEAFGSISPAEAFSYSMAAAAPAPPASSRAMMKEDMDLSYAKPDMSISKKMASNKNKDEKEKSKDSRKKGDVARREVAAAKPFFKQVDTTQEYAETNYWKIHNLNSPTINLVKMNRFWRDYANRNAKKDFVSGNFVYATSSFTELMFAISVLDLPLNASAGHDVEFKDGSMIFKAKSGVVIFHKDLTEAKVDGKALLVMQNFFDPDDRYITEKGEQVEKYITEEFLRHKAYGCTVVVTNVSSARQRADVLLQVPVGAIPIYRSLTTKSAFVDLQSFTTTRLEYLFYWPAAGKYNHFPVHVSKDEQVIAFAPKVRLNVVNVLTKHDTKSWEWISQMGTSEEVLTYLAKQNILAVNLERIAWRLKDKDFFTKALTTINNRRVFAPVLWSYALMHRDLQFVTHFLQHRLPEINRLVGPYFKSSFVNTDPIKLKTIEHLEYWPLVNARAHRLGETRTILNDRFKETYEKYLGKLVYKAALEDEDIMALTYYLLLQDRIDEATQLFTRVKNLSPSAGPLVEEKKVKSKKDKKDKKDKKKKSDGGAAAAATTEEAPATVASLSEGEKLQLQYDYLAAYLDFFNSEPTISRKLADFYQGYPVPRWNKLFASIRQQIKEFDEGIKASEVVDADDRNQKATNLASQNPTIDFTVAGYKINLAYNAVASVTLRLYKMDIELLFSNSPFVQQNLGNFAYIVPNYQEIIDLPKTESSLDIEIPKQFQGENIMIDISAGVTTAVKPHFSHAMISTVMENYGQLRICAREGGKPIAKAYCKVFARHTSGEIKFYKDGYTDLRGGFDYTGLNTPDLNTTERFSILIMSPKHGTRIVEAKPPKQ